MAATVAEAQPEAGHTEALEALAHAGGVATIAVPARGAGIDALIRRVVEPVTAALLVAEVVILLAGVFWRYVLHDALVWTDELATIVLLWYSMLGAVLAWQRGEHMRLSTLLRSVGPKTREVFEAITGVIVIGFSGEALIGSTRLMSQEWSDITPALGIHRSYVVAAIVVASSLLIIVTALRLGAIRTMVLVRVIPAAIAVAAIAWLGHGALAALGNVNLILFFGILVGACVAIGVPIAFSFGFATLSYLALTTSLPLDVVVNRMDEGMSNLILLAVPLFVLLGYLIVEGGIAKRLVGAIASVVGGVRGGLGIVLVIAMYIVSGISGSKIADMAAVAPVLLPEMRRRGTPHDEAVALLAASAAMADTIPPSLVLIILGSVTGLSIGSLFAAGLVPAAVAAIGLVIVTILRANASTKGPRIDARTVAKAFLVAIPGLALPLLIRTFVLMGVATATEVSTVAIVYAVIVGCLIYRELKWSRLASVCRETASLTGAVMLIIATATAMGWALTQSGFAQDLAHALSAAPGGKVGFLAMSIVTFIVLGAVLEGIPALVLFGPLLFPIADAMGVNQIHYAIVVILAMSLGFFAPPFGFGFYAACAVGRCQPEGVMRRILPYGGALFVALLIVTAFPWLSTGFLPHR